MPLTLKPAAPINEVLEFCNKVRKAGGGKPLSALLPGVPQDAESCLIAKNLNFECEVGGLGGSRGVTDEDREKISKLDMDADWLMTLRDKTVRDKIAASLDLMTIDGEGVFDQERVFAVVLPRAIGNVASNFDDAWDRYEQEFDEAIDRGADAKEADRIASKGLTRAMKKYAPYFEQKDAA